MTDAPQPLRPPSTDDARAEIVRAYDRWSARYDADANATRDLDARVLRASGLSVDGRDVLELGCGTAKNTVWLAERARRVVGMDFSPGMLQVARSRLGFANVELLEHDVESAWPLPDHLFDFVIADLILEHVGDLALVFAEAFRVLRAGGTLFVCELHPYRQLQGGQAHFTDHSSGETVFAPAYVHSVGDYANAAIGSGLTLRQIEEWTDEPSSRGAEPRIPRLISFRFAKPGARS